MKTELITVIIYNIILAVALALIIVFSDKIFKKKQDDKKSSIEKGYGFYSDPKTLPCQSVDGKCTSDGTEKTIFRCIPNPKTQKGCIDENGSMTYDNKIVERPCQLQCFSNLFDVQDGVSISPITDSGKEDGVVNGSGCNRLIDKITGLEETNFFLGNYDVNTNKYELKNCIPTDKYQGYYEKTYTCTDYDATGGNNCRYVCGQDGAIRLSGIFDTNKSKELLTYYPTEFDEEGVLRHICYDINDYNQVEILNSTTTVPKDFTYPNFCYSHNNVRLIPNLEDLYPVGTSNIMTNNLNYTKEQNKFFFDNIPESIINFDPGASNPSIVNVNYNLYYDYENYVKVLLNNETMLLKNYNQVVNGTFVDNEKTNSYDSSIIAYVNTGTNNFGNKNNISIAGKVTNAGDNINIDANNNLIQFNLIDFLDNLSVPVDMYTGINTTVITNNGLSVGGYIYSRGVSSNYNNGYLNKVLSVDTGTSQAVIDGILTPYQEKIVYAKFNQTIKNDSLVISDPNNSNSNYTIGVSNVLITNNVILKSFSYNQETTLPINRTNFDNYGINDSMFIYNQQFKSFMYPVYIDNSIIPDNVKSAHTSVGTSYFWNSAKESTPGSKTGLVEDKLDIIDIENKPFLIKFISGGIDTYYYPIYLNNSQSNSTKLNNSSVSEIYPYNNFYITNESKITTTAPESYLNYLDFLTYSKIGLTYGDTFYPVFLTPTIYYNNNEIISSNFTKFTLPQYPDINFYAPYNVSINEIYHSSPPSIDLKLTDFEDIYNLGNVNTSYIEYTLPDDNSKIVSIPSSAQIQQQVFIPNYPNNFVHAYTSSGSSFSILIEKTFASEAGFILNTIRIGDFLLEGTNEENNYNDKIGFYKQMLENQVRNDNLNPIAPLNLDFVVNPEKEVILQANFSAFRTPRVNNNDLNSANVCFDKFNKPLAAGTKITLQPGESLTANIPCSNFNTDIDSKCGVFGLSSGSIPCQQERETTDLIVKTDTETLNLYDDYFNYDGYLEKGLCIVDNKMVCLEGFDTEYDPNKKIKCFPTFFTQEETDKVYAPGEELYITRNKRDYYLSLNNNNTENPLNSLNWRRIFIPEPAMDVSNYQLFYYDNVTPNIFETTNSGITGVEPSYLAVQPVFRKNTLPYFNLNQSIDSHVKPSPSIFTDKAFFPWSNSNKYKDNYPFIFGNNLMISYIAGVPNSDFPATFFETIEFNNTFKILSIEVKSNNSSTLKNLSDETLITQVYSITYEDNTINDINLVIGDIFQCSTNFFFPLISGYLQYIFKFEELLNNFSFTSRKDGYDGVKNLNNQRIKLNNPAKSYLKINQYYALAPELFDNFIFITGGEYFFPSFEVVKILEISNDEIILQRNIYNLNKENFLFYDFKYNFKDDVDEKSDYIFYLFPISQDILNLNFPINNIDGNKIKFDLTLQIPNFLLDTIGTDLMKDPKYNFKDNNNVFNYYYYLVPYLSANFIKKNIVTPNSPISKEITSYLSDNPEKNSVISAVLDYLPFGNLENNSLFYFYINEVRENRYTAEDNFQTTFSAGDIITLGYAIVSDFTVIETNVFYQEKRYDYYCSSTSNPTISQLLNPGLYISNKSNQYFIPYVYGGNDGSEGLGLYGINASPRPGNEDTVDLIGQGNSIVSNIPYEAITLYPYEKFNTTNDNFFNINGGGAINVQNILESANGITYMRLKSTIFYGDNGNITVKDIKVNGKPEGIRYYDRANITDNNINRKGFGCITDYTINTFNFNRANPRIGDEFTSKGGFKIALTDKEPASYQFVTGLLNSKSPIIEYENDKTYSINEIVEYINPNKRIYYRNETDQSSNFDIKTWSLKPNSIYNDSDLIDFKINESYFVDDKVIYQNSVWKALQTNFNITPGTCNLIWQDEPLTENNLISSDNKFYTFTNNGASISSNELVQFNGENVNNFPLCISDYTNGFNYCPQTTFKYNTNIDFSNSFINSLDGIKNLQYIMNQVFIKNKGDDYLSLPAVPYSEDNYKIAKYLRDLGDPPTENTVAQYLYNMPILNGLDEGKPFCTGEYPYPSPGLSNIIFSNSVLFFMMPLDIESQDYPLYNGVSTNIIEFNSVNKERLPNVGMSFLVNNAKTDISTGLTTSILNSNITGKININDSILLKNGDDSVTIKVEKLGYYPFTDKTISAGSGNGYKAGDIWYINKGDENIAHGVVDPYGVSSLNRQSFIAYKLPAPEFNDYTDNDISFGIKTNTGSGFNPPDFTKNQEQILDFSIKETSNFTEGIYIYNSNNNDTSIALSIYFADDGYGKPLNYGQERVTSGTISAGANAYRYFNDNTLKCRLYGLFGSDYFSNISYQLVENDKLLNEGGYIKPGLIFDIYTNDILSNRDVKKTLAGTSISTPSTYDNFYNVFNLVSNDGTSANIELFANPYDKPITNSESNFLLSAFQAGTTTLTSQDFNIVDSNDLHNFPAIGYQEYSSNYLGSIDDVIPIFNEAHNNELLTFNAIRQNRKKLIDNKYDCSFFFQPQSVGNTFPAGGSYDITYNDSTKQFNFTLGNENPNIFSNLTLKTNTEYIFNVSDKSMDSQIFSFGLSVGSDFKDSIIKERITTIDSYEFNITYNIGTLDVDYEQFINKDYYNNSTDITRNISFFLNTNLVDVTGSGVSVQGGFNDAYHNTIIFKDP